MKTLTFSEDDVPNGGVAAGILLHGLEGASLCDHLNLIIRQAEAKELADVTDTCNQVLSHGTKTTLKNSEGKTAGSPRLKPKM